ncbi:MAG: methylthioribulose 1-phosphate dehydratase, partial [Proteobacteria bacterium]|nr:methylthioribulose 1-phosphate dehydratase [Pseudomonadota bacterium]
MAGETPDWAVAAIVAAGRRMDARGWVPATAGNISVRLPGGRIAITRSGGHKGFLDATHVMQVDARGAALTPGMRPSAETLLHCQIYDLFPAAGAVLHGHSVAGTVLSMADPAPALRFAGYELLKAFEGQATHDAALDLPVVDNDQDMERLAARLAPLLRAGAPLGYLIRGHGVYVWGP